MSSVQWLSYQLIQAYGGLILNKIKIYLHMTADMIHSLSENLEWLRFGRSQLNRIFSGQFFYSAGYETG